MNLNPIQFLSDKVLVGVHKSWTRYRQVALNATLPNYQVQPGCTVVPYVESYQASAYFDHCLYNPQSSFLKNWSNLEIYFNLIGILHMSRRMGKPTICTGETKAQIGFAVTSKLISVFVFTTWIVQFPFFLNLKFQASSLLL